MRRDVYIRLAVFVRELQKTKEFKNIRLVLPPWRRLYHWKSHHIDQDQLTWELFFDLESMRRYAPILDFSEFMQEFKEFGIRMYPFIPVHKIVQLHHYKEMFENGVFKDKWEYSTECPPNPQLLQGSYLEEAPLVPMDNEVQCVLYQGSANLLKGVLRKVLNSFKIVNYPRVIGVFNAEIVLHEHWGDREFWRARRSMRFSNHLRKIADEFRLNYFQSTDETDMVQRPIMWEAEQPKHQGQAIGGPYLCAHIRRGDFLHGREATVPTLKSAALQIKYYLQKYNISMVYVSTDASAFELKNLKTYLQRQKIVRFTSESLSQKALIKDGGIAIIEQIICSHAHVFVGTYESTFTYRIYEEREILGFPKERTFNTFCKKSSMENCSKNSIWPIVY